MILSTKRHLSVVRISNSLVYYDYLSIYFSISYKLEEVLVQSLMNRTYLTSDIKGFKFLNKMRKGHL